MARRKPSRSTSASSSDILTLLGAQLRRLRLEHKITQEALAERAGFSYKHIGSVERGQSEPGAEMLVKCARALSVPVGELFESITPGSAATCRVSPTDVEAVKAALSAISAVVDRVTSGQPPTLPRRASRKGRK